MFKIIKSSGIVSLNDFVCHIFFHFFNACKTIKVFPHGCDDGVRQCSERFSDILLQQESILLW